ncbi:MAG: hypothetical protein V4724_36320, partial [Pseudomonadota bacterium]
WLAALLLGARRAYWDRFLAGIKKNLPSQCAAGGKWRQNNAWQGVIEYLDCACGQAPGQIMMRKGLIKIPYK